MGLGLCVDSLKRISLQQWAGGLLLVDELEQVLEHLSTSDTCEERRGLLMLRLAELICFIDESTPDEIIVIATDSQRECQALDEWLVEQRPDIKVLRVDRLTTEEHFIRDFVKRPNSGLLTLKPKVLVYSPTMATGVSIGVDNIKCVFGLFFGATTDKGAAQMLGRVRKPVPRIVWASAKAQDKDICTSPFETEVQKKLMDFHYRTANRVLNLAAAIADGEDTIDLLDALNLLFDREKGATACPHVQLWCRVQARRNGSLAHLAENIKNTLIADGHDVDYSVLKEDNDAFNAISGIKEQVDETANKMTTSPDILIAEAKRMKLLALVLLLHKCIIAKFSFCHNLAHFLVLLPSGLASASICGMFY